MQRFAWFSIGLLWMVLSSCGSHTPAAAEEQRMADILITGADRNQERQAGPGQRVLIQLPENPGTGYRWQIESFDPQVLATSGSDFTSQSDDRLGGGGLRTFAFRALASGSTTVRLHYRRPWEPTSQAAETFSITIHVRMKAGP